MTPDDQISSRRITDGFNKNSEGQLPDRINYLRQRIASLERTLPQQQQEAYAELLKEQQLKLNASFDRAERRENKLTELGKAKSIDEIIERQRESRMPPLNPTIIEGNAKLEAQGNASLVVSRMKERAEIRTLETCYDFLKRAHGKELESKTSEPSRVRDKFNDAARKPDGGRSL